MLLKILILFCITLLPTFELRASIPIGILSGSVDLPFGMQLQGMGEPWAIVFIICVLSNVILGTLLFPLLEKIIGILEGVPFVGKFWERFVIKTRRKIHPYVERWGTIGIALFIAIPLPGSGSYTGALGGYLLGISYRRFLLANAVGVTLAGVAVTLITVTGKGIFNLIFA